MEKLVEQPKEQTLKTFVYNGLDDFIETAKFTYPRAVQITIVNLDQQDTDGFPIINCRNLHSPTFSVTKTNRYYRGRFRDSDVTGAYFSFETLFCLVRNGEVKVKRNTIKSKGCTVYAGSF